MDSIPPPSVQQTNKLYMNELTTNINIKDNIVNKNEIHIVYRTMNKLESEGMQKLGELKATNNVSTATLMTIMEEGEKEFKEKMGRNMTYAEMREIYG